MGASISRTLLKKLGSPACKLEEKRQDKWRGVTHLVLHLCKFSIHIVWHALVRVHLMPIQNKTKSQWVINHKITQLLISMWHTYMYVCQFVHLQVCSCWWKRTSRAKAIVEHRWCGACARHKKKEGCRSYLQMWIIKNQHTYMYVCQFIHTQQISI